MYLFYSFILQWRQLWWDILETFIMYFQRINNLDMYNCGSEIPFRYSFNLLLISIVVITVLTHKYLRKSNSCVCKMSKYSWIHKWNVISTIYVLLRHPLSKFFWFQVVKMFIVVFTVFALCWLPYHLYFICAFLNKRIARWPWTRHIYLVFYFMAMSNAVVNPMIYFAMNAK